jgi:hypothetical protein
MIRLDLGQQIPLEAFIVLPDRVLWMPEKILVVKDHLTDHQADDGEDKILRTYHRGGAHRH